MRELLKVNNWIAGFEWLFFIFANIVIIPITIGSAFHLSHGEITSLLQLSFIVTGIACIIQAFFGHGRAIMEGQSGLWWGVILTMVVTASSQGISLNELGGSLAIGILISGALTIFIGLAGLGPKLAKLFTPAVMGVFMLLFGFTIIQIFLKGMFGLPFGNASDSAKIDLSVALLAIIVAAVVILINILAPEKVKKYGLLIGIIIGWIAYAIFFHTKPMSHQSGIHLKWFPLGSPTWNTGIIISAVIAGVLNTANTFGALKGTEDMYENETSNKQYRASFTITGFFAGIAGLLGLVPYAPFVSSIGFLKQTNILNRLPFAIGGGLFFLMGVIPPVGHFFATIPLSVGSAVLFVAYLQLLNSSWDFLKQVSYNTVNIYRSAIPIFVGTIIMTLPDAYFTSIPASIRPFASSGLLVGIVLALVLENIFPWDRIGTDEKKEEPESG